jgi:sortase A
MVRMAAEGADGPRRARRGRRAPTVVGVVVLVVGLVCLGFAGWTYVGTDLVAHRAYDREAQGLRSSWASPAERPASSPSPAPGATATPAPVPRASPSSPVPGDAIALLRVPRFGASYEVPVVAGTDLDDLARGVGHYTGTAGPGEVGNFALAGHRVTHGQPFARLLELRRGDQVVVETRTAVLTYVMDTSPADLTVEDTAGWVLDPVPDEPGATPSRALLTLTTCQDLFHSPDRSVGFGHLESTRNK